MINFKKAFASINDVNSEEQLQRVINTVQQNVDDAFTRLQTGSVLDNVIIENVVINTTNTLSHKLNRVPRGYLIIKRSANAQVWNGVITSSSIALSSSANVTVSLLIF